MLDNRFMLDDVPKDNRTLIIAIWRTLVRLDLHLFNARSPSAPASRSEESDPLSQLAIPEADELDSESWAELVAKCLSPSPSALDPSSKSLCTFIDYLSERVTWQRRLGRNDEAGRAGDRMHALGRLFAARYPDQPVGHLVLCASFKQMAKNAWKIHDHSSVERNWKLAIDEARRALVLDPEGLRM